MRAIATAHPNIALVKYWGKRDVDLNLPAVGSLSITLSRLQTRMTVESTDEPNDKLFVNGSDAAGMLPRVATCIDAVAGSDRPRLMITSEANFPIAAGLASSASAFAALTVAVNEAFGRGYDRAELADLAGRASGSAARSLRGGFVELVNREKSIAVSELCAPPEWPMRVVVAVTEPGPKPLGSGEAMEISRNTSPFYARWVEQQPIDLAEARAAVSERDFEKLAAVAEHNCLKMHSVMWGSRPPIVYWNSATLACMETVRRLQAEGVPVFFTIDAGPQVKAVCLPHGEPAVRDALKETAGVGGILIAGLGGGAAVEEPA